MSTVTCPNGHESTDAEWCDTCGARIGDPAPAASALPPAPAATPTRSTATVPCPNCGTVNSADNLFCEECGYDFTTGEAPPPPAAPAPITEPVATGAAAWVVVVEVDPAWYALKGTLADQPCPKPSTFTVAVTGHTALVGRTSQSRGVRPEVALDSDTGVSRRHAQLVREGDQLSVVDLSSTNGTYVVPAGSAPDADTDAITPGVPVVLNDGDAVYVGAWTRLVARVS